MEQSTMSGAVDLDECPDIQFVREYRERYSGRGWRHLGSLPCKCGKCAICGYPKHSGIHAPFYGRPPGSEPYGHEYSPLDGNAD